MQIKSEKVIKQDPTMQHEPQPTKAEFVLGDNGLPLDHVDQDDAWTVIRSYFLQHGLVSQQISSFDRFLNFNVQEIINEIGKVQIDVVPQYVTGKKWETGKNLVWEVKFGQVSVSEHPRILEQDNRYGAMFPHESRIRNLTYSTELYADITFAQKEMDDYYIENQ